VVVKKIIFLLCFFSVLRADCMIRLVQDSTLDKLDLYEESEKNFSDQDDLVDVLEEADGVVDSLADHASFNDDPEQYFVNKAEVQQRIALHEVLEYSLDDVLARAKEYPGYYGDSDEQEITDWYQAAQQDFGYQKEILDRIKHDARRYSIEMILDNAEKNAGYKGPFSYQKIVDTYYAINPEKIALAQRLFSKAVQYLYIDDQHNDELYQKDIKKFVIEYRKLPTSLQGSLNVETVHGAPCIGGVVLKNAKHLADWLVAHVSEYEDCKDVVALIHK